MLNQDLNLGYDVYLFLRHNIREVKKILTQEAVKESGKPFMIQGKKKGVK